MSNLLDLPIQFHLEWWEWLLAFFAAILVGISKSGIKGFSLVPITILALLFGSKASTGILLLLFSVGDIFAVLYYSRHTQWKYLYQLLPWMFAGVLLGTYVGKDIPEELFKHGMGLIILIIVVLLFWWDRNRNKVEIPNNWWFAGLMGSIAGFTTMVGNLAGPFANIYFLAMRLPKNQFIGTAAWLFLIINLFKLPFHIFVWKTISVDTLLLDLRLLPFLIVGIYLGIALVKRIQEEQYRKMILILTALGALIIFFK